MKSGKIQTIFVFIFMAVPLWIIAQDSTDTAEIIRPTKGTKIIGTFFNISSSNTTHTKTSGFTTEASQSATSGNLTAGVFISDHWALLANVGIINTQSSTPTISNLQLFDLHSSQQETSLAVSLRYYIYVSEWNYFFFQPTFQYRFGQLIEDELDKTGNNLNQFNYNTTGFTCALNPGFTSFLSKHIAAEVSIGVLGYNVTNGQDSKGNTTKKESTQLLFYQNSINLGMVYYFTKKK